MSCSHRSLHGLREPECLEEEKPIADIVDSNVSVFKRTDDTG